MTPDILESLSNIVLGFIESLSVLLIELNIRTHVRLKIVTWYGHLRDTFAGTILITFQNQFPVSNFLSYFYRQKCRAT